MDDIQLVEKERRLNRVGLSYRCKYCGLPKKGHVCLGKPAASSGDGSGGGDDEAKAEAKVKSKPKVATEKEADKGDDEGEIWDAAAICRDIKAVVPAGEKKAAAKRKRKEEDKGSGKEKAAMSAPPLPRVSTAEKAALREEFEAVRPPSLITPEDSEGMRGPPSSMAAPPASLLSTTSMGALFSPSMFMTNLGTPAPVLTPGLSPGTFDAIGGPVHRELRSARKRHDMS